MKYWWISAIIIIVTAALITCVWLTRKNRKATMITLLAVSSALLIFKSIQFGLDRANHNYPIEFSHLSYFILGATIIVGVKKVRPFAGICSFLSGFAFVIAGIFAPTPIYETAENTFNWVSSIVQHEILLFSGLLIILNTDRYAIKEIWISLVGIAVMVIYAVLVYNRVLYPDMAQHNLDKASIIFMLNGTILKYILPSGVVPIWLRVITIIVEFAILGAVLWAFYFVNNKVYDKKLKKYPQLQEDKREYNLIALVKYIIKKRNEKKALPITSAETAADIQQSPSDETPKQE